MTYSDAFDFLYQGKPAHMHVCRNNAFCWGRIVLEDETQLDVETARDLYDFDDDEAASSFIYQALKGRATEPLGSWIIGWGD